MKDLRRFGDEFIERFAKLVTEEDTFNAIADSIDLVINSYDYSGTEGYGQWLWSVVNELDKYDDIDDIQTELDEIHSYESEFEEEEEK